MINNCQELDYIYLPKEVMLKDKYLIKESLADRSNMSIVYLANDVLDQKEVVVKEFFIRNLVLRDLDGKSIVCNNPLFKDKFRKAKEAFLDEGRLMKKLENEYIARCYDYFEENNTAYLVMKYYKGKNLKEYYADEEFSLDLFLKRIFFPLLNAVNSIHQLGFIHRDIKPSNIIISKDKPILIDFGSAINYKLNRKKKILLTPGFSPIEFYSTKAEQGRYSDVYSLTAILYYLLTGVIPIEASNRIIEDDLEEVKRLNNQILDSLNDFIIRNLKLNFERRDKSITSFRLKLKKEYYKSKLMDFLNTNNTLISRIFNR
ncbi:serine/threonine protein kinase [Orenia marismortui]|uniref:Serine/threonine protein kinase n=1 Tax=Orenia marismortui TaxID=46469 RepID=A0A4R8HFR5_9FIRM|nr:serine/threonine-protein kinase [Orenia marismortui]TDX58986.1 serine/threonine protein kinase [Orenia marismortui]